jgi:predicted transcriptional regulator
MSFSLKEGATSTTEARSPACATCKDNGILIDRAEGTWDVCSCASGEAVSEAIRKGEADIEAGRLYKWSEVRRGIVR